MIPTRMNPDEVARLGKTIYLKRIKPMVKTEENIGKMVIIDVETGEYEVDDTGLQGYRKLRAKHEDALLYGIRIGYKSAEVIGGVLERED